MHACVHKRKRLWMNSCLEQFGRVLCFRPSCEFDIESICFCCSYLKLTNVSISKFISIFLNAFLSVLSHRKPCNIPKNVAKLISVRKKKGNTFSISKYLMPSMRFLKVTIVELQNSSKINFSFGSSDHASIVWFMTLNLIFSECKLCMHLAYIKYR